MKATFGSMMRTAMLVSAVSLTVNSLPVAAESAPTNLEGLELRIDERHRKLYVDKDADFSAYDQYIMLEPYVAFRKNWQRDNRTRGTRVTDKQMQEIKEVASELLQEVFTEELQEGGYRIVTEASDNTLIFRPSVIDLDITAPDVQTAGRSYSFTDSSMSATLVLEMFDSTTGALLAEGASAQSESNSGFMTRANSVTNRADAKKIYRRWAVNLREAWDRARGAN